MGRALTIFMAVFFLWLGVVCLHRPQQVQQALIRFYSGNRPGTPVPVWLSGRGLPTFTRLIGAMCLINFIMLFYLVLHPGAVGR